MNHFDAFAEDLEEYFPEFAEVVRARKKEAQRELNGTIIDYVQVHVSENDPEFQKVLEMIEFEISGMDQIVVPYLSRAFTVRSTKR